MATALGVVLGAVIGGLISLGAAEWRHRRTREHRLERDRRDAYASFMAAVSAWANAVLAYHRAGREGQADRAALWREVEQTHDAALTPRFEVLLLGGKAVVESAEALRDQVREYELLARSGGAEDEARFEAEWDASWAERRQALIDAARKELRVPASA